MVLDGYGGILKITTQSVYRDCDKATAYRLKVCLLCNMGVERDNTLTGKWGLYMCVGVACRRSCGFVKMEQNGRIYD